MSLPAGVPVGGLISLAPLSGGTGGVIGHAFAAVEMTSNARPQAADETALPR